jgi:short-subunit dehydrogenase involved in D-alanine esterification of teichoic acids
VRSAASGSASIIDANVFRDREAATIVTISSRLAFAPLKATLNAADPHGH